MDDEQESVVEVLRALRQLAMSSELASEPVLVAAISRSVVAHQPEPKRRSRTMTLTGFRVSFAVALSGAVLAAMSGMAYAGTLPGAAQSVASDMLSALGVSVPGHNDHAGTYPDVRGTSGTAGSAASGSAISTLARTTTATGRDKGAAISTLASDGKSHAGTLPSQADDGQATAAGHAPSATGESAVSTPNSGGTGTADGASGGASDQGTTTADTNSGGDSTAGSGNRP